jgi:hypothetical protein
MITLRGSGLRKVKEGRDDDRRGRQGDGQVTLPELLKKTVEMEGSDLHITINTPPQVRVHGICSGSKRRS